MIRAIISDMGRVVLWFDNDIFLRKIADAAGTTLKKAKEAAHANVALIRQFDAGSLTPAQFKDLVCRAVGAEIREDVFWEAYNDIFSVNPPAVDVLRRAKAAGYRLILLSNTDPERFNFVKRKFPEVMFFDDYALSYELNLLKPDAGIYLEAARRAGRAPGECVFIDDMEENVRGAEAAGLKGILYKPETDLGDELKKLGLVF